MFGLTYVLLLWFFLIFVQADATGCTPLRIWPRGCDNTRRSFLLFFSDASHFGKPHTHLCPQRLHLQHFPSSFSSVTATHCHLLGAGITRGTCCSTRQVSTSSQLYRLNNLFQMMNIFICLIFKRSTVFLI